MRKTRAAKKRALGLDKTEFEPVKDNFVVPAPKKRRVGKPVEKKHKHKPLPQPHTEDDAPARPRFQSKQKQFASAAGVTHSFSQMDDEPYEVIEELRGMENKEATTKVPTGFEGIDPSVRLSTRHRVKVGGVGEFRYLTFDEWTRHKDWFILAIMGNGYNEETLEQIRREVLGGTKEPNIQWRVWWVPPKAGKSTSDKKGRAQANQQWKKRLDAGQKAGRKPFPTAVDQLFEPIYGTYPRPGVSPTLRKNVVEADRLEGLEFEKCKTGVSGCLVAMVQEFIRTSDDAATVILPLHNITVALNPVGNTRQAMWTTLRKVFASARTKRSAFGQRFYDYFLKEKQALSDSLLSTKRAEIGGARSREKQKSPIAFRWSEINNVLKLGRKRWVDKTESTEGLGWADQMVYLALVCGSRKVELVLVGHFLELKPADLKELQSRGRILPDADPDTWIRQIGVAKKGESEVRPNWFEQKDLDEIYKPLIGNITAREFIEVFNDMRTQMDAFLSDKFGKPIGEITRDQATSRIDSRLDTAFERVWGKRVDRQRDITFHTLRAVYGNYSYLIYAKNIMSLTVWIGPVLGHNLTDVQTALYYQTVRLTDHADIMPKREPYKWFETLEKANSMIDTLNDLLEKAQKKLDSLESTEGKILLFSDTKQEDVWVSRLQHTDRKARELERGQKVDELKGKGVRVSARVLRQLGFGSKAVSPFLQKRKNPVAAATDDGQLPIDQSQAGDPGPGVEISQEEEKA